MHTRVLKQMREAVRLRQYVMTVHAAEEMEDDGFSIYDVEHCILHGEIIERQKELTSAEWKYLIQGVTFKDRRMRVASKISITGKLVIITVYAV
jgi:arginyl-tRNA--protein-N-Asp/Glu arginylyltransferase